MTRPERTAFEVEKDIAEANALRLITLQKIHLARKRHGKVANLRKNLKSITARILKSEILLNEVKQT